MQPEDTLPPPPTLSADPSPGTRSLVAAGLCQALLLLAALWAVRPGPTSHDLPAASALLGLSLLPIGFSLRRPWLRFGAVAWGVLFLVLAWQGSRGGVPQAGTGSIQLLPFLIAAFAAAAGQWVNLGLLPLGRVGEVLRVLSRVLIGLCLLLLLTYLGGGAGLVVALALLFGSLADLALTALTLLIAAAGTLGRR